MATIAKLAVEISANSTKLKTGLTKATSQIKAFSKSAIKALKNISIGIGAGVGAGLAIIVSTVNKYAAEIDKLAKSSDKLGLTVKALQQLQYQAELTGVSTQTMTTALQRMVRRVSEAAQGTGAAKDAIAELGLSAKELAGLSPDQQFYAISEAMKEIGNQGDKVRLAMKIFDTEGVSLVNTMNSNLAATAKEFDSLGISVSQSQAKMVEAYNDSKTKLGAIFSGFGIQLTAQLAAPFETLLNWISKTIIKMGGMGKAARFFAKSVVNALKLSVKAVQSVIAAFVKLENLMLRIEQIKLLPAVAAEAVASQVAGTPGDVGVNTQKAFDIENKIAANNKGLEDNTFINKLDGLLGEIDKSFAKSVETSNKGVQVTTSLATETKKTTDNIIQFSDALKKSTTAVNEKTATERGLYTAQYEAGGVGSIQDYINASPAGKQLQDMRRAGVFGMTGKSLKTAVSNSPGASGASQKIVFELKNDTETLVGELYGNPEFIRKMDEFNNSKMSKTARSVAQ